MSGCSVHKHKSSIDKDCKTICNNPMKLYQPLPYLQNILFVVSDIETQHSGMLLYFH